MMHDRRSFTLMKCNREIQVRGAEESSAKLEVEVKWGTGSESGRVTGGARPDPASGIGCS